MRYGDELFWRMLLQVEANLIGLKDWKSIMSTEEHNRAQALGEVDASNTQEFLQAKGRWLVGTGRYDDDDRAYDRRVCMASSHRMVVVVVVVWSLKTAEMESMVEAWESPSAPISYTLIMMGQPVTYCNDR